MSFQAIEGVRPQPPVRSQPSVDLSQRLGANAVEAPLCIDAGLHETDVAQHTQVLRHGRLAQAQFTDEVSDGALPVPEQIEDRTATRLSKGSKAHAGSMPGWLYAWQGMYLPGYPAVTSPGTSSQLGSSTTPGSCASPTGGHLCRSSECLGSYRLIVTSQVWAAL